MATLITTEQLSATVGAAVVGVDRACPYDPSSPRDMHRTTLFGDEPVR